MLTFGTQLYMLAQVEGALAKQNLVHYDGERIDIGLLSSVLQFIISQYFGCLPEFTYVRERKWKIK